MAIHGTECLRTLTTKICYRMNLAINCVLRTSDQLSRICIYWCWWWIRTITRSFALQSLRHPPWHGAAIWTDSWCGAAKMLPDFPFRKLLSSAGRLLSWSQWLYCTEVSHLPVWLFTESTGVELLEDMCLCVSHLQHVPLASRPMNSIPSFLKWHPSSFIILNLFSAYAQLCRHTGLAIGLLS